jgi:Trk K+ transport system NAD-binding subunit
MKRVMLLGGGLLQSYVIKKINSMGYQSVCVDRDNDAIAFQQKSQRPLQTREVPEFRQYFGAIWKELNTDVQ